MVPGPNSNALRNTYLEVFRTSSSRDRELLFTDPLIRCLWLDFRTTRPDLIAKHTHVSMFGGSYKARFLSEKLFADIREIESKVLFSILP